MTQVNDNQYQDVSRPDAIRRYCKEQCCMNDYESWKNCSVHGCFLWKWRLGHQVDADNVRVKKSLTPSKLKSLQSQIKKAQAAKNAKAGE